MEKKADRVFNFSGKVTYIEKQEITVQSGATFYNGPGPSEDDNQEDTGTPLAHEPNTVVTTPSDWCQAGLLEVVRAGHIEYEYDWAAVLKIIQDTTVFESMKPVELVAMLESSGVLPKEQLPAPENFRKIIVKGKFPEWIVKNYDATSRFLQIGKDFKVGYTQAKRD